MVKLLNDYPNSTNERLKQFAMDLSDGTLTLQDLFSTIKGIKTQTKSVQVSDEEAKTKNSKGIRIVAMNAPTRVEIRITKNDFVLGRSEISADGVITFNKAISRNHCKITDIGKQFYVTDLSSANGTFLNKKRLAPNSPCELRDNDILRLANSDFQVCID